MTDCPTPSPTPLPATLLTPPSPKGDNRTLVLALGAAVLLHLAALLALAARPTPPQQQPIPDSALEVLLVERPSNTDQPQPEAPGGLHNRSGESIHGDAAHSLEGDGETAPPGPLAPVSPAPDSEAALTSSPPASSPATATPPTALSLESHDRPRLAPQPLPQPPAIDAAQILASRDHTVARLAAQPAPGLEPSDGLRRRAVSTSTREIRYASYLAAWTRKVERIGNINYPQAAKEQRIYGSLLLHVSIRADGSLVQVRVVRSSGYDLLDQAAVRIVELAAPFSPFPPDIAAETDVLDIVRNWQFMRGDTLGWEQ
ncbi:biopolymer transporter TonB [Marichromatium purpuratum 984]|uniref:Biopolymer transporter TonB n=1 Tax=Marichromatium purpuratum 984 TaxID=765910 RepID=W0E358_MARPU|nr:energy transducer TonB [Marichromatium purpuratum]AHF05157.1 biopolymer transporter TonB [Marichromatium purpuratum 984]